MPIRSEVRCSWTTAVVRGGAVQTEECQDSCVAPHVFRSPRHNALLVGFLTFIVAPAPIPDRFFFFVNGFFFIGFFFDGFFLW